MTGGDEREAKFDITMHIRERSDTIHVSALYDAGLFDAERIATMLDQYRHLLKQVVTDPEERIGRYTLLTQSQEKLSPFPGVALPPQWEVPVHARFSERARHAPERTAIVDARGIWSYGELEHTSNLLAWYLHSGGIKPGDVVAVYGHRSAGLVLALLGTLKAGAAFLVLDPSYPAARLMKMMEQSRPSGWLRVEAAGPVAGELSACIDALPVRCRFTIPRACKDVANLLQGMPPGSFRKGSRPGRYGIHPFHIRLHGSAQGHHRHA